jgi:hypothetical protein
MVLSLSPKVINIQIESEDVWVSRCVALEVGFGNLYIKQSEKNKITTSSKAAETAYFNISQIVKYNLNNRGIDVKHPIHFQDSCLEEIKSIKSHLLRTFPLDKDIIDKYKDSIKADDYYEEDETLMKLIDEA